MPRRTVRAPVLAVLGLTALAGSGCVHKGYFTDGTSVSYGKATRGILVRGRELPVQGTGYVIPHLWRGRGARFGVDEMVEAIERAAARVEERLPGGLLGVGDLSFRHGGGANHHRSHANGRDADLIFFAVDEAGSPLAPLSAMPRYGRSLKAKPPRDGMPVGEPLTPRRFDVPRNWELVSALLEDHAIDVEYLFLSEPLRDALLDHAARAGASDELLARAKVTLRSPGGHTLPHDDHLHLRIRCPSSDRALGCVDEGKVRLRLSVVPPPPTS